MQTASTMADIQKLLSRPHPPIELVRLDEVTQYDSFVPAPDVTEWIRQAYLDEAGPLFTEEHAHLADANIACLWTSAENNRHGRRIIGQAELGTGIGGRSGKWQRARAVYQLEQWFGEVPDFLLTFDALYAVQAEDASFCALVDHELYHCAQATDRFGMPMFSRDDGKPVWTIQGHDVEEFVGVVRRFGIEAAGEAATEMVIAASKKPEVAPARLSQACGTCTKRRAA